MSAFLLWSDRGFVGEPEGWVRSDFEAKKGYRRRPHGDASREYEAP